MDARTARLVTELRTLPLGTQLQVVAALLDGLDADCGLRASPPGNAPAPHGSAVRAAEDGWTPAQQAQQTTRPATASGSASTA
jgi:hypothetical protein